MLIQKHQSTWSTDFNNIKEVITSNIKNTGYRIEHVGSTAVKNLAAKPIIDIDIVYSKAVSFEEMKSGLEKIGYNHIGNLGIEKREVFKRENRKEDHLILDTINHHLYLCPIDSEEFHRHVTFRDYLRANEKERQEYESLKFSIAEKVNQNRKKYAELKEVMAGGFIEAVLAKANGAKG